MSYALVPIAVAFQPMTANQSCLDRTDAEGTCGRGYCPGIAKDTWSLLRP